MLARIVTTILTLVAVNQAIAADIIVGVAGPHSGAYAAFGEQLWRGAEQAAADINANGGIDGNKIVLVKADDACEPKQAVSVAHRIIDRDKVQAVIGHFCSSSTIPASEVYADAGVLMITPASTNPMVTERNIPTVLRTCGRDDQQGATAADFIANKLKAKKVAIIHDKDTYGKGIADATMANLEKYGIIPVLYEGLTRGEKDFNAVVTKLRQVEAEVVYFGGLHTEAGPLVRQIKKQGLTIDFVSGDGIMSEDFITSAGGTQVAKGVYMTFGADPRKIPHGKDVIEKFRAKGYEPEGYTLYSYATLEIIMEAIKNNHTKDGLKLATWLKQNTINTVIGPKNWDEKGDLQQSDYVMYVWREDGSYSEVN